MCAMKYSGATIGVKYSESDLSVDMIMKEVELPRPLSPLMDVVVRVAGKKERKRKIKTEEICSTSKKKEKKTKKENNRMNGGNQAGMVSGSGDAQASNSSHSFNTGQHFKIFLVSNSSCLIPTDWHSNSSKYVFLTSTFHHILQANTLKMSKPSQSATLWRLKEEVARFQHLFPNPS